MKRAACLLLLMALLCASRSVSAAEYSPLSPEIKALTTHAPYPRYPFETAYRMPHGSVTAMMHVDKTDGRVTSVDLIKSSGNRLLDDAALKAFRSWRFKPGTVSEFKMAFGFHDFDPQVVHTYFGTVTAINPQAGSITLRSRRSAQLVVSVTPQTRFVKNGVPITFRGVAIEDHVRGSASISAERKVFATSVEITAAPASASKR